MSAEGAASERPAGRGPLRAWIALASAAAGALMAAVVCRNPYANPDSHAFEALARAVASGHGLSYREPLLPSVPLFAFRNPLYPVAIAGPLEWGGLTLVLALQGALAGLTALGIASIAGRLGGVRAAWWAWGLAMLWTPTWLLSGQLLSEVLYVALAVAAVDRTLAALRCGRAREGYFAAGLAGAAAAGSMLTRSPGFVLAVALAAALLPRPRVAATFALVALLVWLPWPIRNHARLHAFVPLSTNGQMNLYAGNSPVGITECWYAIARQPELGELGFERYFAQRTRTELLSDPGRLAARIARKALRHVVPLGSGLAGWLLMAFEAVILVTLMRRPSLVPALLPLLMVFAGQWALQALTVVGPRYRYPTDWLVIAAFAVCLAAWPRRDTPAGNR